MKSIDLNKLPEGVTSRLDKVFNKRYFFYKDKHIGVDIVEHEELHQANMLAGVTVLMGFADYKKGS